ncbi:MAG TPA: glycosyltransferase family 39 protein [Candidatus Sulfotelmatobacter sp.]|nr:glycosyltransferase family 39 protein [Candidatus Sulfotelmatobacter sp.]
MKVLKSLEKSMSCWFLIFISIVFFFLRFPSLYEPNWYGDEGIYQTLGLGMNAGRLLYRDIFDNKPPLLYFLYSLVSSDQFAIRFLSLIAGLLSITAFYFLSKKILENQKASIIATSFFAILFGLPFIEGNIANAENFMLLPNIITGILVLKSLDSGFRGNKTILLSIAGFVIGISFLLKIVAIFDFSAFLVFIFFANFSENFLDIFKLDNLKREFKNFLPFLIGFLIPISFVTLIFLLKGAFSDFLTAILFSNIGYVGYGNKLIIPQGFLILKLLLLSSFLYFIFIKRKSFGNYFVFSSIWLSFSIFNAFFSQRPYTHYVLVLLPSFCLLIGFFALNKKISKLAGSLVLSTFIIILLSFNFYWKTIFYYQNFVSFLAGTKSVYQYQRFFDGNTPNDYEISNYLNMNLKKEDNLFIWGNNAQVYDLTNKLPPGKYTVAYHISNYKDGLKNTNQALEITKPKYIVIMSNVSPFPFVLSNYINKIDINRISIYEKISN